MDMDFEWQISAFAFLSRLIVLVLQCVANFCLPDHDANVFNPPTDPKQIDQSTWIDWLVHLMLGGFCRWDAVYFTHIMQYGYTYENCVAFFPMYPLVSSTLATMLAKVGILNHRSWILLVSVFVNIFLFVLTARALYRLGKLVIGNTDIAFNAAILFCFNPASIFMTAPYSEIMYMYLLIQALLKLDRGDKFTASVIFGLSVFTRSNGLVGAGFLLHSAIQSFLAHFWRLHMTENVTLLCHFKAVCYLLLKSVAEIVIYVVLTIAPFLIYQYYIYTKFCLPSNDTDAMPDHLVNYGRLQEYHLPGDLPSAWCHQTLPLSYSYIQKHHWDVGFLSYYKLKQVPNFLLAAPVIVLSFQSCLYFFSLNSQPFYTLGFAVSGSLSDFNTRRSKKQNVDGDILGSNENANTADNVLTAWTTEGPSPIWESGKSVVYVFHLAALVSFGCFFIHIQVLTRLIFSSSPLIYWYIAALLVQSSPSNSLIFYLSRDPQLQKRMAWQSKWLDQCCAWMNYQVVIYFISHWPCFSLKFCLILFYFISYFVIGTIMFSNFLPWT